MKRIPLLLIPLFFLFLIKAEAKEYQIGPHASWIQPIKVPTTNINPKKEATDGQYYLLVDKQVRNDTKGEEFFRHYAQKVINEQGAEQVSQVSVDFTPAFESLTIHQVHVLRDGKSINQLKPEKIRLLQREEELDSQIYNGSKTINLIIDDIRVGDILEYSYTIKGLNPAYRGKFYNGFTTQWSVPVRRSHIRILIPKERELFFRHFGKNRPKPIIRERGEYREYRIDAEKIPAIYSDGNLPSWYNPYPWTQFSEHKNWSEVVDWALPHYQLPKKISPELEQKIREIDEKNKTTEKKIAEAIRFVQDQVRYLGIEIGLSSYKPTDPSIVFQRRFGDCKEKTMLLKTMLSRFGVNSYPALVNTKTKNTIIKRLPAPTIFNHVILQIHHQGKLYWIDPTITYQRGTLDNIYQPDYGTALVVQEGNKGLEIMKSSGPIKTKKEIYEKFDLKEGYTEPIDLTIRTTYHGYTADYNRRRFATRSLRKIEKDYINYYASEYPKIKFKEPLSYLDDPIRNQFTTIEKYTISEFWEIKKENRYGNFWALLFYDYTKHPSTELRTMPLAVSWPINLSQTTEVKLPDDNWNLTPENKKIENKAISFLWNFDYDRKRTIKIRFKLRTKKDHVRPENTESYLKDLDLIKSDLSTQLYIPIKDSAKAEENKQDETTTSDKTNVNEAPENSWYQSYNWTILLLSLVTLALSCMIAKRVYDNDKSGRLVVRSREFYPPIEGWVSMFALYLFFSLVAILGSLYDSHTMYTPESWSALTGIGSADYNPIWEPKLLSELILKLTDLVFSTLLIILFLQRRAIFPRLLVLNMLIYWPLSGIDLFLDQHLGQLEMQPEENWSLYGLDSAIVITTILYFTFSKKVKETFICKRPTPESEEQRSDNETEETAEIAS